MRTIKRAGAHEIEVRRSRFICAVGRVDSAAAAREFIAGRRRAFRDATHHCTAYVVGERGEITRNNDDGEPAGTAGLPMLEVLTRGGLTGTVAVVTRYFGGVKLGTGGLARAYGRAVAETLALVGVVERRAVVTVTVQVEHALAGRLASDLHASRYRPGPARYTQRTEIDVLVPGARVAAFEEWVAAATAGRAVTRRGAPGHIEVDIDDPDIDPGAGAGAAGS